MKLVTGSANIIIICVAIIQLVVRAARSLLLKAAARDGPCAHGKCCNSKTL